MPSSTISPLSITIMLSALETVDKRCAIIRVVLPLEILFRFSIISFSVEESKAEVASSKKKIEGFFNTVRAIATRCFSPPDNFRPLSPTIV